MKTETKKLTTTIYAIKQGNNVRYYSYLTNNLHITFANAKQAEKSFKLGE